MQVDTEVTFYDGPIGWFREQVQGHDPESFFVLLTAAEADPRRRTDGQELPEYLDVPHVAIESTEFASLTEGAISNFAGLVRKYRPGHLHVHNPPNQVRNQLARLVRDADVQSHEYPGFTRAALAQFQNGFTSRLVGQQKARDSMLASLYTLSTPGRNKPVVAMLYGPSGVGKTETALFLSELAGGELLRKQFSMFHSEKFASYLFGGSHSEPSFAHDLLNRDSNVVLIDEFDKAHPSFYSAFYQLFDGGEYEDKNYSLKVGPALILCTSNFASEKEIRDALGDALFSRFDVIVPYEQLTPSEIGEVIQRILEASFDRLTEQERAVLDREDLERRFLRLTRNPGNVRRIRKVIDETISKRLAQAFLSGKLDREEAPKTRAAARAASH